MFEGKTLWQIFNMGGFTMYVLLACSVLSIGVILERLFSYYARSVDKIRFMNTVRAELEKGELERAARICEAAGNVPVAAVVRAGLRKYGRGEKEVSNAMEREIMVETVRLERYTSIVGTIGNTAVYIGLFGTVLGIVRSFHNIS
ncbi:MAG: MotA/TolQ/ExbB proton channel family protein, partial [Endomicrobiales bacterium]